MSTNTQPAVICMSPGLVAGVLARQRGRRTFDTLTGLLPGVHPSLKLRFFDALPGHVQEDMWRELAERARERHHSVRPGFGRVP